MTTKEPEVKSCSKCHKIAGNYYFIDLCYICENCYKKQRIDDLDSDIYRLKIRISQLKTKKTQLEKQVKIYETIEKVIKNAEDFHESCKVNIDDLRKPFTI